ncbi:FecR family protein [Pedobacter heparinus]|uniref:FecR protein n=1 Tax=Pedobacter heparinus (strain ATCC 13125 / DSM 2366 / CIP 104194 / JCM 7457 / NBRC 12017 / NCIMB 9290 / NRRL B-14731 / HIM 762-3) TaxID=485917 RepID=C6Y3L2_PEDHD|nr:FecR family protein [Pedobacter heparinus]ACU03291.1 FecR protein [Pedobacter heparinus DSM 2366]
MEKKQFILILGRYLKQQATPDEERLLHTYYHLFMADSDVLLLLNDAEKEKLKLQIKAGIDAVIENTANKPVKPVYKLWPRIAIAAAAVAAIVFGVFFFKAPRDLEGSAATRELMNDIAPGKNTATLTLANGKTIILSDVKTGVIVDANSLKYNDNTLISTEGRDNGPGGDDVVMSTPRGGTYQITLPDGTRAWLNADTKISFPSQFIGKERKILIINGEVYFEVAKNKEKPFIVESDGQEVTVLGTHFNISAYKDEGAIKTTLLEGSVKVSSSGQRVVILKPNQQSTVGANAGITVKQVDPEDAIAWKEGYFIFNSENLDEVMRRVSRWYNVQVVFEDESLKHETFIGTISKYEQVSKVLNMLARTKVAEFKIEGNTIIINKKK